MAFWRNIGARYRDHFRDREFVLSFIVSFAFLFAAFVINYLGSLYALERASNPVSDIFLSNVPVMDVDILYVFGPILFWVIVSLFLLHHPRRIPFSLKAISLFILVRSLFVSMTHIAPFPDVATISSGITTTLSRVFSSGSDLFFSGHTGGPFLMALVLWRYKRMRVFCICSSIFLGFIVLLGHYHYTVDVVAAFFITYSIYHLAERVFRKDKEHFLRLFS